MSLIKKALSVPVLLLIHAGMYLTAIAGHLIGWILSLIVGLTGICTIWAWIVGDKLAPIFLGAFCLFAILMGVTQLLTEKGIGIAAWISRRISERR